MNFFFFVMNREIDKWKSSFELSIVIPSILICNERVLQICQEIIPNKSRFGIYFLFILYWKISRSFG